MVGGFRRLPLLIYSLLEENTEENTETNENDMRMDGLLPECIRSVSDRFDVTCSTVLRISTRMCEAVVNNITPHFNQWPTGERLQQVVEISINTTAYLDAYVLLMALTFLSKLRDSTTSITLTEKGL